ncbi:MAG: DUF4013 domain-containing protein, partial [Dehalococcoidia bacterium]|nr:DUF4013 domain-containing protein [Dehalococcoidia bacterium]
MNFGQALTYAFDDPRWVNKLGYAAVFAFLTLVLVGYPMLIGYTLQLMRNVRRGDPSPLPEWTNLGALFVDGLKMVVVLVVWSLPVIAILCLIIALQVGLIFTIDRGGNPTPLTGLLTLLLPALFLLLLLAGLLVGVVTPALYIQYAQTERIPACFRVSDVFAVIRRNVGAYALVLLVALGAGRADQHRCEPAGGRGLARLAAERGGQLAAAPAQGP